MFQMCEVDLITKCQVSDSELFEPLFFHWSFDFQASSATGEAGKADRHSCRWSADYVDGQRALWCDWYKQVCEWLSEIGQKGAVISSEPILSGQLWSEAYKYPYVLI